MPKSLCIYHANCIDGFAAAWVVRRAFADDVDFWPGIYGEAPPDVAGRHVFLVDFSYKRADIDQMAQTAASITILDHHKTAAAELAPFTVLMCGSATLTYRDLPGTLRDLAELQRPPIVAYLDPSRSGAGIAWDFFYPKTPRPPLINLIEDRDLWRFKLRESRSVHAALSSYPHDFAIWDDLMERPVVDLAREGASIDRKHLKDITDMLALTSRRLTIAGFDVPAANLPPTMASDAGNVMAEGEAFAAVYWDTANGRQFSLRSDPAGMDVSAIAAKFGGGGHKHAAGFKVAFDRLGEVAER